MTTDTVNYELVHLDPNELKISAANLRKKRPDVSDLVGSIKEVGVLQPLVITKDNEIVLGYRRSLAAIKAKTATVPCLRFLGEGDADTLKAMLAENTAREPLTDSEEAAAYSQLALLNVPLADVARATGRTKELVESATKAGSAPTALAIAAKYDFTMEQLITLAEFEGEDDVLKELAVIIEQDESPWHLENAVRRHRRDLENRSRLEAEIEAWRAKGVAAGPSIEVDAKTKLLELLVDDKGKKITESRHRKCPGHFVQIHVYSGTVATDGWCTDWRANGHALAGDRPEESEAAEETSADLAAQDAALKATETRAKNKVWRAAGIERRKFIAELIARPLTPAETASAYRLLVWRLTQHEGVLKPTARAPREYCAQLFGIKAADLDPYSPRSGALSNAIAATADEEIPHMLIKLMASTAEPDLAWQNADQSYALVGPWLDFLTDCGYEACEMEVAILAGYLERKAKTLAAVGKIVDTQFPIEDDLAREARAAVDPNACRVCGCSDEHECDPPCAWMGTPDENGRDICSRCAELDQQATEAEELTNA